VGLLFEAGWTADHEKRPLAGSLRPFWWYSCYIELDETTQTTDFPLGKIKTNPIAEDGRVVELCLHSKNIYKDEETCQLFLGEAAQLDICAYGFTFITGLATSALSQGVSAHYNMIQECLWDLMTRGLNVPIAERNSRPGRLPRIPDGGKSWSALTINVRIL
jgi:hypothetical protein